MTISVDDLDQFHKDFPGLKGEVPTSKATGFYNCIAYAAGDNLRWYWPMDGQTKLGRRIYWPPGVPREETVDAFIALFEGLQYSACADGNFETGVEKIAIYATLDGVPSHAAIQRTNRNGRWRSKIGENVDIEHDLEALCGEIYGRPVAFLRKKKRR